MIQITAYLRDEEDLSKWKAIPNKAAWFHEKLKPSLYMKAKNIKENPDGTISKINSTKPASFETEIIKTPEDARKAVDPILPHKTFFKEGKKRAK